MVTRYPHVANGFSEDCLKLLTTFEEANDIRFQTFCRVWQKMKFSLVFTCRETFSDLLEFCEEAIHIAKYFFLPPFKFNKRIGGLYLLYGLYYKMPVDKLVKIRVTLTEWTHIMDFHNQIKEAEHSDANFILSKMLVDCAFVHCLFEREFSLEKHYKVNKFLKFLKPVSNYSVLSSMMEISKPNEILNKMNELSKQYEMKKSIILDSNTSASSIQLFNSNFAESIIKDVKMLKQTQSNVKQCQDSKREKDTSNLKPKRRKRVNRTRSILGHGFDTDTSDENNEEEKLISQFVKCDPDMIKKDIKEENDTL